MFNSIISNDERKIITWKIIVVDGRLETETYCGWAKGFLQFYTDNQ